MVYYSRMRGSQDYNGRETFNFSILRYRNPITNELVIFDNSEESWDEVEIDLSITAFAYFQAGVYSGPIEDSYPDESDFEIEEIIDLTNNQTFSADQLIELEKENILIETIDLIKERAEDHSDDYRD